MKTTLTVDNDGILTFPEGFLEKLKWKEGDILEWIDNKDGSLSLVKQKKENE
jgi:bifunctional DNA-binding transcriptional regulator/antitoxin component of YhaV-PrlF toxin-antitoxin module